MTWGGILEGIWEEANQPSHDCLNHKWELKKIPKVSTRERGSHREGLVGQAKVLPTVGVVGRPSCCCCLGGGKALQLASAPLWDHGMVWPTNSSELLGSRRLKSCPRISSKCGCPANETAACVHLMEPFQGWLSSGISRAQLEPLAALMAVGAPTPQKRLGLFTACCVCFPPPPVPVKTLQMSWHPESAGSVYQAAWEGELGQVWLLFANQPDLRRILADDGFEGQPFRKDSPCLANGVPLWWWGEMMRWRAVAELVELAHEFCKFALNSLREAFPACPQPLRVSSLKPETRNPKPSSSRKAYGS